MMRLLNNFNRFLILSTLIFVLTANTSAQDNINELYGLVSSKQLPILEKFKNRGAILQTADTRNNYIYLSHEEWKGWGEMSLFEKKSGGSLIALTEYNCKNQSPSYRSVRFRGCEGTIRFWQLKNNELVEAKGLLPDEKLLMLYGFYEKKTKRLANSDDKLIYELPRERKDIKIMLAGEVVYSLVWNGEKFEGSYVE